MSPRTRLAAGLALALAGCTLTDRRTEPVVLPEGMLYGGNALQFEVRAAGGARANVRLDGVDYGSVQINTPISISVASLAEGEHRLQVTVFDGPYPARPIERAILVDRVPPTYRVTGVPTGPVGVPLALAVTFSEPVQPQSVIGSYFHSGGGPLPAEFGPLSADGLTMLATLLVPLQDYLWVQLVIPARDLAGNGGALSATAAFLQATPSPVALSAPAEVDGTLTAVGALPAGWDGPAGPISVSLCPSDSRGLEPVLGHCSTVSVGGAGEPATIDTSALPSAVYFLLAQLPGYGMSSPVRVVVLHHVLAVSLSPSRPVTNGPVRIAVTATGGFPQVLEILAGEVVFASIRFGLGRTGTFSFEELWPAEVQDGVYQLGARAPGWRIDVAGSPTVTVDRTPPVATQAWPASLTRSSFGDPAVTFSEPVTGAYRFLVDDTTLVDVTGPPPNFGSGTPVTQLSIPALLFDRVPWADADIRYDASAMSDRAGNTVVNGQGSARVPTWFPAEGPGPIEVGGAPLVAAEAVVLWSADSLPEGPRVAYVDAGGQVRSGRTATLPGQPLSGAGRASELQVFDPPSAFGGYQVAWVEADAGARLLGAASVVDSAANPPHYLTTDAGSSPLRRASVFEIRSLVSWTEPDGLGRRKVRLRSPFDLFADFEVGLPTGATDAVTSCCTGTAPGEVASLLAWIDDSSGVPQLALSQTPNVFGPLGPWTSIAPTVNADPRQAASAPALLHQHLAWVEGARVRAGRVPSLATGFVRADPTSASGARHPVFLDSDGQSSDAILLFVEPGATGDVIAARRWTPTTGWAALPAVNAGVVGEVRHLGVSRTQVTWTDAAGHVYARRLNR